MTTDAAFVAAGLAGASILVLAVPLAGARLVAELAALLLLLAFLTVWTNRWRQPAINAVVEHRQRVAAWVAIAERDSGEIYGSRARAPFLAALGSNVQRWSSAEELQET